MPRMPKKIPALAVAFVAFREGFLSDPSDALDGHATVGFGHLIHLGPVTPGDRKKYGNMSRATGRRLLRRDLHLAASDVRRLVKVPLNRRQFSMLVSFTYNCGSGALAESTLLRRLNAGEYSAVPYELSRWVNGPAGPLPGLVKRRRREGKLFRPLHRPNPKIWR
jgi:lysozyme